MTGAGRREWLALMAKAPVPGEVKTRLQAALGAEGAAALYECFLHDTTAGMRRAADERPSVALGLCAAGLRPGRDVFANIDLGGFWALAQLGPTLGARLEVCFDMFFAPDGGRGDAVVAIGADSPSLPTRHLVRAFELLEEGGPARVVLGPAADGGYYLIGMSRPNPSLFAGVAWSTGAALGDTLRAAAAAGLEAVLLPEWYDVDTDDGLDRLRADLARDPSAAPVTARHLGVGGGGPAAPAPGGP